MGKTRGHTTRGERPTPVPGPGVPRIGRLVVSVTLTALKTVRPANEVLETLVDGLLEGGSRPGKDLTGMEET